MLRLIPDRMAVSHDQATELDLLLRITPPVGTGQAERPELNLALVLDRSGSMQGRKMELTRQAAGLAVQSLLPHDRISVVIFDTEVDTLVPCGPAVDKPSILRRLERVHPRGSTALCEGWSAGGLQARQALDSRRVNRVLLLTDGQANEGEIRPDAICNRVHQLARQGVQTTTLGFGEDYNEDLLRAMAQSGEGNHFYVEAPEQLADFFRTELGALAATQGTRVRLGVAGLPAGARLEWLSESEFDESGQARLADLVSGCPLAQVVRLHLPPQTVEQPLLTARLTWLCPYEGIERCLEATLTLPLVSHQERAALEPHPEVQEYLALVTASRLRREAMERLREGNPVEAVRLLQDAIRLPSLPDWEQAALNEVAREIKEGHHNSGHKRASAHGHASGHGRYHRLEQVMLKTYNEGSLALEKGPLMGQVPSPGDRPAARVEGMLRGLFYGEALGRGPGAPMGEASALVVATLETLVDCGMLAEDLAQGLARAPVAHPSTSLRALRENLRQGASLDQLGVPSAGCGALRRIAPILIPHRRQPSPRLWTDVALAGMLTHNDNMSHVSCLGFTALLWDLLASPGAVQPGWYAQRFLEAMRGLENGQRYRSAQRRFQGFKGTLTDFLEEALPLARARGWSVFEAFMQWGSGPYLLETVPSLLYVLERHGHDPDEALRQATGQSLDPGTLGALVGAAVGALHGSQPGWVLEPDLEQALWLAARLG